MAGNKNNPKCEPITFRNNLSEHMQFPVGHEIACEGGFQCATSSVRRFYRRAYAVGLRLAEIYVTALVTYYEH